MSIKMSIKIFTIAVRHKITIYWPMTHSCQRLELSFRCNETSQITRLIKCVRKYIFDETNLHRSTWPMVQVIYLFKYTKRTNKTMTRK